MPANLQGFKLATNELSSATKQNAMIQGIEDSLNNIGDPTKSAFVGGQIFDPAQIKQVGATPGQGLIWSGTQYTPTTLSTGAYTMIQDSLLGADGTFSFTGIPATFKHLQLICYLRSDRGAAFDDLGIQFNGDTAANYDAYSFEAFGTGPSTNGNENYGGTKMQIGNGCIGNSAGANLFSGLSIAIPDYANTTNNKSLRLQAANKTGTAATNMHVLFGMGSWRSNAAISRIDVFPTGGGTNFNAGSHITLYGL